MRIRDMVEDCHSYASGQGFWELPYDDNQMLATKLMLVVTELGEACEALRLKDSKNFAEELADTVIRIFDISGYCLIDLEKEIASKMNKNRKRPKLHGKAF